MPSGKGRIYFAGVITLFGIGGLGILLMIFFQHKDLSDIFLPYPASISLQLIVGFSYGLITAFLLIILLKRKILQSTRIFFSDLFGKFRLNYSDIVFLSFCAGVGEELLFRGALQPWLGVWFTALIFIALHGYLNPKDKPLFIYGIVLFIVSAGFGYMMKYCGFWSAAAAHFIVDVVLMIYMRNIARGNYGIQ